MNIRTVALALIFSLITLQVYALDYPHTSVNNISCNSCHFVYGEEASLLLEGLNYGQDIDDTQYNALCWSCHNDVNAPYMRTHSSLQADNSYGDWSVECRTCHNPHSQRQIKAYGSDSYLESGISTEVMEMTLKKSGASWTENEYKGLVLVPNVSLKKYGYKIRGNTADTITVEGPMDLGKVSVGNTFAIIYGKLVQSTIVLDEITGVAKSGDKTVRFFDSSGTNSFADGNSTYDGVCEVCHTETTHFRHDGSGSDQLHTNVGTPAGTNCIECHSHTNGFAHGGGGGTGCEECHGHDPGYGGVTGGAGTYKTHSTHTENDSDDLRGPNVDCDTCHNTDAFPDFADGVSYGGYKIGTPTTVCNTCHSPAGTYDGVSDEVVGAQANWREGVYEADGSLKTGKEKWCATCHDEVPSVINSISAPNVIGDEDGAYTYGIGWGYYRTGHGLSSSETYPSKGGVVTLSGRPVECDSCHNFSTAHIDGEARTYNDNNNYNTDPSVYRIGYRLDQVQTGNGTGASGKEPLLVPSKRTQYADGTLDANNFRLCFKCHEYGPFLDPANMNTSLVTGGVNRHAFHLKEDNPRWSTDWDGIWISRITCMTCHNVHGSTQLAMVRDGKLINSEPGLEMWYHDDPAGNGCCEGTVSWSNTDSAPPTPENLPLSASTGTIWRGITSINLKCADCHKNPNTVAWYRNPYQNLEQVPTLAWAGEDNFVSDGANPDSGVTGDIFNFRVKYTDTTNNAPSAIQVWIDEDNDGYEAGEKHDLTGFDPLDSTYYNGKLYSFSTTLTNTGGNVKPYRFYAVSNGNDAAGPPASSSSVYVFDSSSGSGGDPALDWTGETDFSSDGVNPDSAVSGSTFEFRVKYSDNNAPALIQLWIDEDRNGAFNSDEKYVMVEDGGGDYAAGRFFTRSLDLTCAGGCSMSYRFYATDGAYEATGVPVFTNTVTVLNNAPVLSWTGETDYETDGVDPNSASGGSNFIFRVKYTDVDNTPPTIIKVWVDKNDDNDYEDPGEGIEMEPVDSDSVYTDGKNYTKTITLTHPGFGDDFLNYRFSASDGNSAAIGDPVFAARQLEVTTSNPPDLDWTGETNYTTDGVDPDTGMEGGDFTFRVKYMDSGNTAPAFIQVWVDLNDDSLEDGGELTDLIAVDSGDSVYSDGKLYTATIALSSVVNPSTTYYFKAGNGTEAASGNATVDRIVTVVTPITVCPAGPPTCDYDNISDAIVAAFDGDYIFVKDGTYSENIYFAGKDITIVSENGTGSTRIQGSGNNSAVVTFNNNEPASAVLDGFTIDNQASGAITRGVYISNGASPTINDCIIENNNTWEPSGAGLYITGVGGATITNSTIRGNRTGVNEGYGGGIYYDGTGALTISDSNIDSNHAQWVGGGLYINSASAVITITRSTINSNDTGGNYGGGGFYYVGGALPAELKLSQCFVQGNRITNYNNNAGGSGMRIVSGTATIANSVISGNTANGWQAQGGGIYNSGTLTLSFSTITDNFVSSSSGGLQANGTETVSNSIIWGNSGGSQIGGTVENLTLTETSSNPLFVSRNPATGTGDPRTGGNYQLQSGSNCIDTGDATDKPVGDNDIEGNLRPVDVAGKGDGVDDYDKGAYEYVP